MTSGEAKRLAELWLAAKLKAATGISFTASEGGETENDDADEEIPRPVMGVGAIRVVDCQSLVHGAAVFQMTVVIGFMTHMGDSTASQHSLQAGKVQKAIIALVPEYCIQLGIRVSGVDLREMDDFTDEDEKTRGDAFTVTMGVSF